MHPQNDRPRKKALWFPCGRYFARTIKREDASDRWASWLSDPWTAHVLNTPILKLQKSDIIQYIKKFDQRSRLLIGIFERRTGVHVGIVRLDIDYAANEALVNAIIGEAEHRNKGATVNIFVPILDYLFDTVRVDKVKASILMRNQVTMRFLLKLGWQIDQTKSQVKSKLDGTMLDLCSISYTREAYRAYKQTQVGKRILQRLGGPHGATTRQTT
ncbi:MAG: GNAT family N-acetyltransferase [Xanthobacteraceae bacterium]